MPASALRRKPWGIRQLTIEPGGRLGQAWHYRELLAPGWFRTDQNKALYENKEWVEYLCDRIPLKRPAAARLWMRR